MIKITICPTCGPKSKRRTKESEGLSDAVQDEEAFKKIAVGKRTREKYIVKAEALEKELETYKLRHK